MKTETKFSIAMTLITFIAVVFALSCGQQMLLETRSLVSQYLVP